MQNVLVTGGAGYIGSTLVPILLTKGYSVTVIDKFIYKQNSLAHVCYHPNLRVVRGDVRVSSIVRSEVNKADIIIPLAALVGAPICSQDPVGARSVNLVATLDMFKMLSNHQWVLMPTTNSAYGNGDANHYCDEGSPLKPISQYAKEKVEIEEALMGFENAISFRLATVFGMSPRMRLDLLVNDFVYRAVYDRFIVLFESHFKRNYIHVRDVANVFLHALDQFDAMKSNVFNVGLSSANLSKKELCETIKNHVPEFTIVESAIAKDVDQRNYIVSNEKIEKTGFSPKFTIDMGIRELMKGYQMIKNNQYANV